MLTQVGGGGGGGGGGGVVVPPEVVPPPVLPVPVVVVDVVVVDFGATEVDDVWLFTEVGAAAWVVAVLAATLLEVLAT